MYLVVKLDDRRTALDSGFKALEERAEVQNTLYLAGDPGGVYGEYPPADLDGPPVIEPEVPPESPGGAVKSTPVEVVRGESERPSAEAPANITARVTITVGEGPHELLAAEDTVFVSNWTAGTVSEIDQDTDRVVRTIPIGGNSSPGPMARDMHGAVYVSNNWARTVSVIGPDSVEVDRTVWIDSGPGTIAVDARGRIHVVSGGVLGVLNIIAATGAPASDRIDIGYHPGGIAIDTSGTVFVAISDATIYYNPGPPSHIVAINPRAKKICRILDIPVSGAAPLHIDAAGHLIVASPHDGNRLLDIDPDNPEEFTTIDLSPVTVHRFALGPNNTIYAVGSLARCDQYALIVIDRATLTTRSLIELSEDPSDVAVGNDGAAYLANRYSPTVTKVSFAT
jgi:YVTN family beta-propeller protein